MNCSAVVTSGPDAITGVVVVVGGGEMPLRLLEGAGVLLEPCAAGERLVVGAEVVWLSLGPVTTWLGVFLAAVVDVLVEHP
jgi:hypothetical protein